MSIENRLNKPEITTELASKIISKQFPDFVHLPIKTVKIQGHDNRTFRLGEQMLIRLPTAESYALKVPKEQELLPKLAPYLSTNIPIPLKMGVPSEHYPFPFSIYKWLEGESANSLNISDIALEHIAIHLARFLKELQNIDSSFGPLPGQHNWWRGDHISVYEVQARKQIHSLKGTIDQHKAIELWESALKTKWENRLVWVHGDFASGNILLKEGHLVGVIDFGGMAIGDPACDLVIAWTFLRKNSRKIFKDMVDLDPKTWRRARAWALWKATFELCQIKDKNSLNAIKQREIINEVLDEHIQENNNK